MDAKLTETQTELLKGVRAALGDMATELEREIGRCDETRGLDLVRVQIDNRLRKAAFPLPPRAACNNLICQLAGMHMRNCPEGLKAAAEAKP